MATKQINPTRMELQKLRKQLETTSRGHKLLKDKQDELIHSFIPIIREYKELRLKTEAALMAVLRFYRFSAKKMSKDTINEQISEGGAAVLLSANYTKLMGVNLPNLEIKQAEFNNEYDLLATTSAFDELIINLESLLAELIALATIENKVKILIREIEKSKRRVNAIENIVIKEIVEQIKDIRMKLTDLERSNTIRMMKSKEIIINKKLKQD